MLSEKLIYNTFLKISRSQSGLPYKLRKQWHGFEDTEAYPHVLRLKNFFSRNSGINMNDFFSAPYTVYPGESGFDIGFYSSQKAIKVYSLALKKKMNLSPDDTYHLEKIAAGLRYIRNFCIQKNINIDDYPKYKEGIQHSFIVHLKEHKVSVYNLFAFNEFEKALAQNDPDLLRFTLGEVFDLIPVYRTKYLNSTNAKKLAYLGLEKIKRITS